MTSLVYPAHDRMRNSEFIRYVKDAVTIFNQNNPTALKISQQLTSLTNTFTELDTLFKVERGNVITADLEAMDERRDRALTGIRYHIESYAFHFDPEVVKAAQLATATFNKYGKNLPRLNYFEETEVIVSLVSDFEERTDLVTATQSLRLDTWLDELATANRQFNELYIARSTSNAARPSGNLLAQRAVCVAQYDELIRHIEAHRTLTPSAAYEKLVSELNDITNNYNQVVTNRRSSGNEALEVEIPEASIDEETGTNNN